MSKHDDNNVVNISVCVCVCVAAHSFACFLVKLKMCSLQESCELSNGSTEGVCVCGRRMSTGKW